MNDKDLQHLAAIVRDSDDAIIGKTLEGIITSWNGGAERIYGYTAAEAIGCSMAMLVPTDREDELPEILRRLTEGQRLNNYDTLRVTKDGSVLNISLTISPIRDASGAITGASSIGRDVTKEKEAETALRESARAYKQLMEQASDAILVSYPDQPLLEVNQRASDMLGYTREELLQLREKGNALPDGLSALVLQTDEILEGDIAYAERPVRRKDGTLIVTELSARRLDDGRVLTLARDVTARKRAEEALRESEERHRAILEQVSEAIFLIDPDTKRFVVTNPAFQRLVSYTADELLDMTIYDVLPYERERIDRAVLRALDGGDYRVSDRLYRRKDGSLVDVEVGITPVIYSGRKVLCQIVRDITERKQAEEAVAKSEAELRALFAAMTDVVLVLDAQGRYLQIAPTSPDLLYKPPADLLGRTIHEVLPVADADSILHTIQLALEKQHPVHIEYSLPIGDREVWFDGTVSPMGDDKVFWIARDITERKLAEETNKQLLAEMQFERERLHNILNNVPGVVWEHWGNPDDGTRHVDFVSDNVEAMLGYSVQEWLSTPAFWLTIVHPEDVPRTSEMAGEQFLSGRGGQLQFRWIRKDGRVIWVEVNSTVMFDDTGRPIGIRGVNIDITERKQAELELEQSEKRFRALIENSSDGITLVSAYGMLTYASDSTERILGYSPEEVVGHDPMQLIHPDDQAAIGNLLTGLIERPEGSDTTKYRVRHKDGSWRWIESMINNMLAEPAIQALVFNYRDITERKRAEESLRESEERYRLITETATDVIIVIDEESTILFANSAVEETFGYSIAQIVGQPLTTLMPESMRQRHLAGIARYLETGRKQRDWRSIELPGLHKSGKEVPLEISFAESSANGKRIFTGIMRDITERKRAEESLRLSGEILQRVKSLVLVSGKDGQITYASPSVKTVLGYEPQELLGDGWWQHSSFDPEEGKRERSHNRDLAIPEAVVPWEPYERKVKDKDGELHWILWQDVKGPDDLVIGVGHDITERKESEKSLRESEERFRLMFASNPLPMWVYDVESLRFLEINEAAVVRYGYSKEEFLAMRITDIRPMEEILHLMENLERVRPALQSSGEWRHQKKDGQIIDVQITSHTFTFGGHEPSKGAILVVAEDITERKKMEEARLARETAEEASRAKSEFLSRMSHELRTPLNAILGFGQLLQMDDTTPEQQECVEYIIKAGQHLLNLINEVLDIARIEEGRLTISMEPVFVRDVVQESLDLVQALAARRDIEMKSDLEEMEGCYVMADRQRLQQVLLNLLANSIKYNHEGGVVNISCSQLSSESDGTQQHEDPQLPAKIRISVSDTGPGLPPDKVARLFTPFERLGAEQGEVEGTGLGLALSKHLMEAMGGAIGVESEEDKGCTFWVELAPADVQMPGFELNVTGPLFSIQVGEQDRTMLYIEDNLSNLRLIERILSKRPEINLISAMQGQMGLDMAYEHRPDLILLDLHLPDMPGNEVLLRLQEDPRTASIPVVVLSADANPRQVDKLMKAGARAYLTKPLNVKQLLKVLEEIPMQNLD